MSAESGTGVHWTMSGVFTLVLFLVLGASTSTGCPGGFTKFEGACFKVYHQIVTYDQARQFCATKGGLLAMPKDNKTDDFLWKLKNAEDSGGYFWFGLSDENWEGRWMWEDGTIHNKSADWSNWREGQPDNHKGDEDCAHYNSQAKPGWNDLPCSDKAANFICQTTDDAAVESSDDVAVDWSSTTMTSLVNDQMETPASRESPGDHDLQMITFPAPRSVSNYARLMTPLSQDLMSFTLCLHMRTDHSYRNRYRYRQTSLVSYAVGGGEHANELLLFNDVDNGGFQLWVRNVNAGTVDLPVWDGAWHEICATWRSSDGHWQIYSDGALRASGSGLNTGGTVRRGGTWILAQDQDTVGGAFVESQAFSGELSQVNLWDRMLSSDEIGTDWSVFCKHHGNVIDWATANINISGLASSDQYLCGTYSKPTDCPDDYQPFQGICYKAYSVTATFHESLRACSEDGGTLAMPRDMKTNNFLVGLKNSVDRKSSFWFGLHDRIEENVWKWIDGEELGDFTDWGPGEPNDYKQRNEDCVVYYPPKKNKWNDMPCLNKLKFICQVDTTGYTPYVNEKIAFKVFAQLKTYEAAKQTCASDGGHLADLKTQALHDFVLAMIQNVDASRDYWIGLNDMTVESTWTWSDGTPVSNCVFANWVPGEPNDAGTGQDCGQLWTDKAFKWDDDFCGYQQYFICQKGFGGENSCERSEVRLRTTMTSLVTDQMGTPAARESSETCGLSAFRHFPQTDCGGPAVDIVSHFGVTVDSCAAACCADPTCLSFQYNTHSNCYLKSTICAAEEKVNAAIGNMYDRIDSPGVAPVSPHTVRAMEGETVTLPVQSKVDLGRVIALTWSRVIGESDNLRVTVYMYSTASKGRALRPLLGRASLNTDGSLRIDDAKLSDEGEYIMTKIMAFSGQTEEYVKLVIIDKSTYVRPQSTLEPFYHKADCPQDYQPFQGICYKVYSVTATFHESLRACGEDGGTLAMPRDMKTNNFLVGLKNLVDQKSSFWFGLHDRIEENVWKWIDGEELGDFTDWGPGEPNDYKQSNEDCVEYSPLKKNKWNDMPCLTKLKFICQVDTTGYTPYVNENIAFKVFAQSKTYEAAKQTCASDGGHLADLKTQALHDFVLSMIQNVDASRDYWIGLNDITVESTWTWSDGTPVSHCAFANWVPGEPNNAGSGQDCGRLWKNKAFKWDDYKCGYQKYFICQKGSDEEKSCDNQPKDKSTYVRPQSTLELFYHKADCTEDYQSFQGICYKASKVTATFHQSLRACSEDGGTLAMPRDKETNDFLVGLKNSIDQRSLFWFGLHDSIEENVWKWIDGEELGDFTDWGPGEPNNAGGEDCVVYIPPKKNKWNDMPCLTKLKFICQVDTTEAVRIRSSSNDVHYDGKAVLESPVFSTNCSNSSLVFHYRMQGSVVPATLYVSIVSNESNSDPEVLGTFPFELTDGEKDQVHLDLQREQPFRVVFTAELDHHSANSTDRVGQIQLYDVVVLDKCRPIDGSAQAVLFQEPAPSKVPVLSNGQSLPNGAIIGIIVGLVIVAVAIATGVTVARRMRGQYDRFVTTSTTVLMMRDNVMFEPDVE